MTLPKLARAIDRHRSTGAYHDPHAQLPRGASRTRLWPVDGKNMNRAFPGERNGTITSVIAHYVYNTLFP